MTHRNRKLFDLVTKNAQRIASVEFLDGLPDDLRNHLEDAEIVYHPELSGLGQMLDARSRRLREVTERPQQRTRTKDTSSRATVWKLVEECASLLPEGEYVLIPSGGNGVAFDGDVFWVSKLPGFVVSLPQDAKWIASLAVTAIDELTLTSRSGDCAVVVEAFGGYLPGEQSDREMYYEFSSWGLRN